MQTKISKVEASTGSSLKPALGKAGRLNGIELVKHCENRRLSTETVLACLRMNLPKQYEVA
jgi:hypothetical protein